MKALITRGLPAVLLGLLTLASPPGRGAAEEEPLYGPGGHDLSDDFLARVGQLRSRLQEGHKALRALDMDTARETAAWIRGLGTDLQAGVGARYFLARVEFYEGRYPQGLALLGPEEHGEPAEVAELRRLLSNLTRVMDGFKTVETAHFTVSYQPGPDAVLLPYLLDTLERSYVAIGSELGHLPTEKVRVEIFPTSDDFIAVSSLTRDEIQTTGIIALCVFNKLMITSPRALALGYRWLDTASHEYIHQVVALRTGNQVPVWLQEGLAKFFEVRWRGGRAADLAPMSENLLAEALETGHFVPFEKMSPSVAKLPSQEEAQLAFAQVETFIEMIVERKGLDGIRALLAEMNDGKEDRAAVAAVLGVSFSEAEAQWKAFVAAKKPKKLDGVAMMPVILQAQAIADGEASPEEKVTDPFMAKNRALREYTRLGDLLRDSNRFRAALIEYAKAEAASTTISPALQVKIAKTYLQAGDLDRARERLEKLVEEYDGFGPAWAALGEVRLAKGDVPGALKAFEEANASNPFDPAIHVRMAGIYSHLGKAAEAEREEKAVRILTGEIG